MRNWLRHLAPWIGQVFRWLWRQTRSLWIAVIPIAIVGSIALAWPAPLECRVRYAGLAFELLGIGAVAIGLRETRKLFRRPSLLAALRDLLASFPSWKPRIHQIEGRSAISFGGSLGVAKLTAAPPAGATLEQRVEVIETQIQSLNADVNAVRNDLTKKAAEQKDALDKERRERADEDAAVRKLIEQAVAGGLSLEATGVFWLVIGVVLATASQEIARIIG